MNIFIKITAFYSFLSIASSTLTPAYENCQYNCFVCSESEETCLVCSKGSVMTNTGRCESCSFDCIACTGTNQCVQCYEGSAVFTSPEASICIRCSIGCLTCESITSIEVSQFRLTTCTECMISFYPTISETSSILTCEPCTQGCFSCNNSACNLCVAGFSLNETSGLCYDCSDYCEECNSDVGCLKCSLGLFLSVGTGGQENTCESCMANCIKCTDSISCEVCYLGFYKSSDNSSCLKCEQPCSICNATLCFECSVNFYLNSSITKLKNNVTQKNYYIIESTQCSPCPLNCFACTAELCKTCYPYYYVSSNGTCESCPTSCSTCTNSVTCLVCDRGYLVLNNICESCMENCEYCEIDSSIAENPPMICNFCSTGYFVENNTTCANCSSVMPGCYFCFNPTQCLQCQPGFILTDSGICSENGDESMATLDEQLDGVVNVSNIRIGCFGTVMVGMAGIILWNWCFRSKEMILKREETNYLEFP